MKFHLLSVAATIGIVALSGIPIGEGFGAAPYRSPSLIKTVAESSIARCTGLAGKDVAGARIDTALVIAKGVVLSPYPDKVAASYCKVEAHISPVTGSHIKILILLPDQWNGKLAAIGGGGFEGGMAVAFAVLRGPVASGYAVVTTNAGHDESPEPRWALESHEKLVDYGDRANHLGAVVGKAMVAEFYGSAASHAYFHGCSNGGRDALMMAQRHPEDFDAIAAGAPVSNLTGLISSFARNVQLQKMLDVDLSAAKMQVVHAAVMKQCDASDGVADGVIERPGQCRFDPKIVQCRPGSTSSCLSAREVDLVRQTYGGTYLRDGRRIVPGFAPGSEYEWAIWRTTPAAIGGAMTHSFFRYMVQGGAEWNELQFDLDRDYPAVKAKLGPVLDAVDPDLRPYLKKGGKLLLYHGWDDAAIPPQGTIDYYTDMQRTVGPQLASQTRLFMLPGVAHCVGGVGPGTFDYLAELDRWTETGSAPETIIVSKPDDFYRPLAGLPTATLRTRPACPYPKSAHYKGSGSTDEAENFVCK